jgi:hypothetical protein
VWGLGTMLNHNLVRFLWKSGEYSRQMDFTRKPTFSDVLEYIHDIFIKSDDLIFGDLKNCYLFSSNAHSIKNNIFPRTKNSNFMYRFR